MNALNIKLLGGKQLLAALYPHIRSFHEKYVLFQFQSKRNISRISIQAKLSVCKLKLHFRLVLLLKVWML